MTEQEVFLAAIEIADPQARKDYIEQACAGNRDLRQSIEKLIEMHLRDNDFLAQPALEQLDAKPEHFDIPPSATPHSDDREATYIAASAVPPEKRDLLEFLSPSEQPGSLGKLGHYEVHGLLGHGAFGIVLKAFDEKLHRMVAIKVLAPELARTSPPRKRFLREARAAAAIRHENVIAIHSVEEHPIPFLVMEYIPGDTLQQVINDHGPLDVADLLRLGQQIAAGLAAAHSKGLIHRDIKPANILLDGGLSGQVKISDFGLARTTDDANMTQSGMIAGTPLYMSPEQATTGQLDQRSDLFSLGSVLYVMTTGRPPFRAPNTLAVLKRVVDDAPRPPTDVIADTPDWLCAIISKLHEKQPDNRFATAQQVARLLGKCLDDLKANRPVALPEDVVVESKVKNNKASVFNSEHQLRVSEPEKPNSIRNEPRGVLSRAWHDWRADRDRWITRGIQSALILIYLICMICFVSMHSEFYRDEAGHQNSTYRLGWPSPWFDLHVISQSGSATVFHPWSSSAGLCLVGCLAFSIWWRIETVRNPQPSRWLHPRYALGLWGVGALAAVLVGNLNSMLLPDSRTANVTKTSSATSDLSPATSVAEPLETSKSWHGWPTDAPKPAIAPFAADQARRHQEEWAKYLGVPVEYENSLGMKFRLIPPGEFLRGSTIEEIQSALPAASGDGWKIVVEGQGPQHKVILTQPWYFAVHETTQDNYQKLLGKNPSHFSKEGNGRQAVEGLDTGRFPVENLSQLDAVDFCVKLSEREALRAQYLVSGTVFDNAPNADGYRLPTEAEWEFACRAGTTTLFHAGSGDADLDAVAWYGGNSGGRPHPVGERSANAFGLFDLHGNILEWCEDGSSNFAYREYKDQSAINPRYPRQPNDVCIFRGGTFLDPPVSCWSAFRNNNFANAGSFVQGFRAVLTIEAVKRTLKDEGPMTTE